MNELCLQAVYTVAASLKECELFGIRRTDIALLRPKRSSSLCSSKSLFSRGFMQAVENNEMCREDDVGCSFVAWTGDEVRNVRIQRSPFPTISCQLATRISLRRRAIDCCWKLQGTSSSMNVGYYTILYRQFLIIKRVDVLCINSEMSCHLGSLSNLLPQHSDIVIPLGIRLFRLTRRHHLIKPTHKIHTQRRTSPLIMSGPEHLVDQINNDWDRNANICREETGN